MELQGSGVEYGPYGHIVVVFNASSQEQNFTAAQLAGLGLKLHPIQAASDKALKEDAKYDGKKGYSDCASLDDGCVCQPRTDACS